MDELVNFMKDAQKSKNDPTDRPLSHSNTIGRDSSNLTKMEVHGVTTPKQKMLDSSMMMRHGSFIGTADKQIKQMQEMLQENSSRIEQLMDILDEKLDRAAIEAIISDKVGKEEIADLLPDMEAYENKLESRIEESIDVVWQRLEEKLMGWDQRMIAIRNEFDIVALNKLIESKAQKESVADDFRNHEFKIQTLDSNVVRIAQDFE